MSRRIVIYLLGTLILALGISLATQTGLGISPILSLAYLSASLSAFSFPTLTFGIYILFVIIQLFIYLIKRWHQQLMQLFSQIIISFLFSSLLGVFLTWIPNFANLTAESFLGSLIGRLIILLFGTFLTGVGASLMLMVQLIPTPADGIVQTISKAYGYPLGFVKNILDMTLVVLTILFGFLFLNEPYGIGIGTLVSMIGVGRVIAWFNHHFHDRIIQWIK